MVWGPCFSLWSSVNAIVAESLTKKKMATDDVTGCNWEDNSYFQCDHRLNSRMGLRMRVLSVCLRQIYHPQPRGHSIIELPKLSTRRRQSDTPHEKQKMSSLSLLQHTQVTITQLHPASLKFDERSSNKLTSMQFQLPLRIHSDF